MQEHLGTFKQFQTMFCEGRQTWLSRKVVGVRVRQTPIVSLHPQRRCDSGVSRPVCHESGTVLSHEWS